MGNTSLLLLACLLVGSLAQILLEGQEQEQEREWEGEWEGEREREQELTPAQTVLEMVPASARGSFLLYQLATAINSGNYPWLALEQEQEQEWVQEQEQEVIVEQQVDSSWLAAMANEFQGIPVYESFPLNFETWLTDRYGINAIELYQSWPRSRSNGGPKLCNAVGQCYEVAQIVAECCPF